MNNLLWDWTRNSDTVYGTNFPKWPIEVCMCTGTLFGEINSYRCIIKGVYPLLFIPTTIFTNLGEYYYSVDRTDESDSGSGI